MSKKDQDQGADSVLEILYADFNRIATFIAQFGEFGHLTAIVQEATSDRTADSKVSASGSGDIYIAKGEATGEVGYSSNWSKGSQRSYDPRWVNTLHFLDEIDNRSLLRRDIKDGKLGDFVLHSGSLKVRDLSLMEKVWGLSSVRAFADAGDLSLPRQQRRANNQGAKKSSKTPSELDLFFELAGVLPHTVQAVITSEETAWGLLNSNFLSISPTDFILKHGAGIAGEWGVVGVLDAYPDEPAEPTPVVKTTSIEQIMDVMLSHLEPITRQFLGRPPSAFGVTPLVIFRTVGDQA